MGDGGSQGTSQSSGTGYSRPLSERAHPAQWALYGPTAAMLTEKAFGGARDKQITETGIRNNALESSLGATQRLGNQFASQGISPQSPLYAAVNRGIQTNTTGALAGAQSQAEQAQRATQTDYAKTIANFIGNWPPPESWSTQQSSSTTPSSGGMGK